MTKNNFNVVGWISLMVLVFTISISAQDVLSHGNIDQETSPFFDFTLNSGVSSTFLKGQVFVPTAETLIAVDVGIDEYLSEPAFGLGDKIEIRVHQGTSSFDVPGTVFSQMGTVTGIDGQTYHFDLDSAVPLIPGQPHILEIVRDDPNAITWRGSNTNSYDDGYFVFCNLDSNFCGRDLDWDHSFRTYSAPGKSESNNGPEKVLICHVDQETGEKSTMNVTLKASEIHLEKHTGDEEGECTPVLSCSDQTNAGAEFLEQCIADGNSAIQCGPPLYQFLITYALDCEGVEEEKIAACQVAKDSYLNLCGIVGPDDNCEEEAETLYNGCVDGTITTDPGPFD